MVERDSKKNDIKSNSFSSAGQGARQEKLRLVHDTLDSPLSLCYVVAKAAESRTLPTRTTFQALPFRKQQHIPEKSQKQKCALNRFPNVSGQHNLFVR